MTDDAANAEARTERLARLGSVVAGFAHEIRNPLSTIGLNLQLVMEDLQAAESPRERRTYKRLGVVESEVKRLQSILEEFLGFVRSPGPQPAAVDLDRLLRAQVELVSPEMAADGITLKYFPGSGIGQVLVDADQLRAAIVNLLRNAREACRAGDEVLLSSRRVGDTVQIQVTDTGSGMTPDVAARVFEPYFSTKKSGTGLGLAMVRRTVEAHGGRITVSSEPGKGTQFTMTLPVRTAVDDESANG